MKRAFQVTLEMPRGVKVGEMSDYILDAVQTWKGQLHPDDPLFDLDYETVRVVSLGKVTS